MEHNSNPKHILLIDRQDYWRKLSAQALKAAGFSVQDLGSYEVTAIDRLTGQKAPDLIILGCADIDSDELGVISHILKRQKHRLLVLSNSLPWQTMRALFLAGANDVVDKTYDPNHLVDIVEQALLSTLPRDSYQATKQRRGI